MQAFFVIPVILILAFLLGELFRKTGLPSVVGQILAGVILSLPVLKELVLARALPREIGPPCADFMLICFISTAVNLRLVYSRTHR